VEICFRRHLFDVLEKMYKYLHIEFENMLNMSFLLLKYTYSSDVFSKFASIK